VLDDNRIQLIYFLATDELANCFLNKKMQIQNVHYIFKNWH